MTMSDITQVVIMAGGRGTRLGDLARSTPKPLIEIGGTPNIEHQIGLAKKHGFTKALLLVSHMADAIRDYFGHGERYGIKIAYSIENPPLGTAGALLAAADLLDKQFLLLYGDVFVDCDLTRIVDEHIRHDPVLTMVTHPNDHPHDSDIVETDATGRIVTMHAKGRPDDLWVPNNVNSGVAVLNRAILSVIRPGQYLDLASQVYPRNLDLNMRAYRSSEYFKDFGAPERLADIRADFVSGRIDSFRRPRPTVFLDRDGVINKLLDHLHHPDQLELIPGAAHAIQRLNRAGHLVIVVTNQPVVARGDCTVETLRIIHNKMETLLGREGAWVDAIYYCPHHPDGGFAGEVAELKIDCDCRKPKTGLYEQATRDWSIAMGESWVVGDSFRDILSGKRMGFMTIGVKTGHGCRDCVSPLLTPYFLEDDISDAVEVILS
jgi:histidinol-phosphate phosphatase family protein